MLLLPDFSVITIHENHYKRELYWVMTIQLCSKCGNAQKNRQHKTPSSKNFKLKAPFEFFSYDDRPSYTPMYRTR
jgi:hypothetical protein